MGLQNWKERARNSVDHHVDNVHEDAGPGNAFYEPVNKYC